MGTAALWKRPHKNGSVHVNYFKIITPQVEKRIASATSSG